MPLVKVPTLSDGVVTLRAHREEDVDGVVEQSADALSIRWTRVPVPYSREDARRFVREAMPGGWAADTEWAFAIEAPDDGVPRFAGTVSLRNEGPGRAEIAYGAHPWARGRGYVDRALRLLLDWGFSPTEAGGRDLHTVIWWAEAGNWASRRTAWRLGFSCDASLAGWLTTRDGLRDGWVGVLGREDARLPRHRWWTAPVIVGAGVRLRPFSDDDIPRIVEACADERASYWLGQVPVPFGEAEATRILFERRDQMARGTAVQWAITDPDTDVVLGSSSVFGIGAPEGPEVGYWAHPDARGRGLITEAVGLIVRHVFIPLEDGGLGQQRLRLRAAVDNTASRHVAERNGFRLVGIDRLGSLCRDGHHDEALYDLVAADVRPG
jgi:RimJ/RimL family protein N-acetyltransferase